MTMVTSQLRPASMAESPLGALPAIETGPGFDLLGCVRALDGWVAPDGLAPRAVLDDWVEQGLLETWPGRPLYRAARRRIVRSADAGDAA